MAEFWDASAENRIASNFPDLSQTISDDRGRLRFPVFISRQNLRRSGKSKVPDRVGFYQHTRKTPGTDADSFQSLSITPSVATMPIDCLSQTFSYMLTSFSLTSRLGGVKQRESNKHIDTVIGVYFIPPCLDVELTINISELVYGDGCRKWVAKWSARLAMRRWTSDRKRLGTR